MNVAFLHAKGYGLIKWSLEVSDMKLLNILLGALTRNFMWLLTCRSS
jgi:hypothetical protein